MKEQFPLLTNALLAGSITLAPINLSIRAVPFVSGPKRGNVGMCEAVLKDCPPNLEKMLLVITNILEIGGVSLAYVERSTP